MKFDPADYSKGLMHWRDLNNPNLTEARKRFLDREELDPELFNLLKDYFRHWVECPALSVKDEENWNRLRLSLSGVNNVENLHFWLFQLWGFGINPL